MSSGLPQAALAFTLWGLFPLYFALLAAVPPLEVLLQRCLWSALTVVLVLTALRRWAWLPPLWRQPRVLALGALSAALLAANWWVYVHAVQTKQVVDASLGYFINPLVNVLLGVLVLRERLSTLRWLAVALAAAGVAWMTWQLGRLPWIALVLACSFGLYGLVRKTASLGALEGLALETLLLAPVALPLLVLWQQAHGGVWVDGPLSSAAWLALSGPLSVLPLLLFAAGARRLPLATLGLVQYLSPTLQLLLGVWVFGEPFDGPRVVGFVFIWTGLALVSLEALRQARRGRSATEATDSIAA